MEAGLPLVLALTSLGNGRRGLNFVLFMNYFFTNSQFCILPIMPVLTLLHSLKKENLRNCEVGDDDFFQMTGLIILAGSACLRDARRL